MEALFILKCYKLFNNNLKFYKHNLINDEDFDYLVNHLHGVMRETKEARVLALADNCSAYKINDEIYFIPSKPKAVVNNGEGKLAFYFEYPCEMKREDLVELL